jgi:hypothetical protein
MQQSRWQLFRHRGVVYVGRPRVYTQHWEDDGTTYSKLVEVYDPCWCYLGNWEMSERHFHDVMRGEYPLNATWVACDKIQVPDPDISIPFENLPGYASWRRAVGLAE